MIIGAIAMVLRRVQDTLARTVPSKAGLAGTSAHDPFPGIRPLVTQQQETRRGHSHFPGALTEVSAGMVPLQSVGIHQGYLPEQPINYSHQLHAGKLQIQCIYCHSGAERKK